MPDSTRPKTSMFFQVVKGYMTNDGSLKRIIANPGGKNFSIIFSYITSKSFESVMLDNTKQGKSGKEVFGSDSLTVDEFLEKIGWPITHSNEKALLMLFHSYSQDKALKAKRRGDFWEFSYLKDLEYPSDQDLEEARTSNKFIMDVIDDLNDFLIPSLEAGSPVHDRTQNIFAPLWEAMLSDPLISAFQDEMVYQAVEHLPQEPVEKYNILQFGTGAGNSTISLIEKILEIMSDCSVHILGIEEIPILAQKSQDLVNHKIADSLAIMKEKNLKIDFSVETQDFYSFKISETDFNMVLGLQILINITERALIGFFDRISHHIAPDGVMILGQSTSYSKEFPYPMSIMYLPIKGFMQFPTKDELYSAVKDFFSSVKSSGLDAIWVLKDPRQF